MNEGTPAEVFGDGEQGRKLAEMMTRTRFDLPLADSSNRGESESPADGGGLNGLAPDQAESNQINPVELLPA